MCCGSKCLVLLPLFTCLAFPVTFCITLGFSAANNHVNVTDDFPYISETGNLPPESCIFGQLLNIAAVVTGLTVYIRYSQTKQALEQLAGSKHAHRMNFAALIVGMVASFGVSIVGNFQFENMFLVHLLGAGLAFIVGSIYCWMQCYISFVTAPLLCSRRMFFFRVVLSAIATLFIIGTLAGAQYFTDTEDKSFRLLSTISEWIMALSMATLFGTFTSEFRATKMRQPDVFVVKR